MYKMNVEIIDRYESVRLVGESICSQRRRKSLMCGRGRWGQGQFKRGQNLSN